MPPTQTTLTELSSSMRQAVDLLQRGQTVAAEEVVLAAADAARKQFGKASREDELAQGDLGSILLNLGQLERAIEAFGQAVAGPMPNDAAAMRDRLTYLMNLGQALQTAGRLDEASDALLTGLEGRESFYGRDHAGYAFGLEPLAEVSFALGKSEIALDMMDETVRTFWKHGHPRVAGAIAIRAAMLKEAGRPKPPFVGAEKLPDEVVADIARQVIARATNARDLKITRQVLAELAQFLNDRLGRSHPQTLNTWIAIANIERKLAADGDTKIRQGAIQQLIAIADEESRSRDALQSVMALALAQSDAGDIASAVATYHDASKRADKLGDPSEKSQVLRNHGLLMAESGSEAEAEPLLRSAVETAEQSGTAPVLARALIALGLFLQHANRLGEARPLLARALPMLESAHPDALTCRSHLQAIDTGGSCGCGDMSGAIADAFRDFVLTRAPAGLVARLDVTFDDGDFSLGVHLNREPREGELQHLHRVTEHALQEFRRKLATEK